MVFESVINLITAQSDTAPLERKRARFLSTTPQPRESSSIPVRRQMRWQREAATINNASSQITFLQLENAMLSRSVYKNPLRVTFLGARRFLSTGEPKQERCEPHHSDGAGTVMTNIAGARCVHLLCAEPRTLMRTCSGRSHRCGLAHLQTSPRDRCRPDLLVLGLVFLVVRLSFTSRLKVSNNALILQLVFTNLNWRASLFALLPPQNP